MGIPQLQDAQLGFKVDVICSLPKGSAATEKMVAYGALRGRGATFLVSPDIIGKNFKATDSTATTTSARTYTFKRTDFLDPQRPTMQEVATALSAAWDEATDTDVTVGAIGELIVSGAATGTTNSLTIGAGTANELLGFPSAGVIYQALNGTGLKITLPATFAKIGLGEEWLYTRNPLVIVNEYTTATGVRTPQGIPDDVLFTWTPSTRILLVTDIEDAAKVVHVSATF